MIFYEIKITYDRQTGESNPGSVKEIYLIEGINCSDVEQRLLDEIKPFVCGNSEVQSCRKAQYYDIFPNDGKEYWYKGRVEMITIDNEKETRKAVNFLVQANTLDEADKVLSQRLSSLDCEIIAVNKTKIMDVIRAVN